MATKNHDYIITDLTGVRWPGALPYHSASTRRGRGYATEDDARARLNTVVAHYNAKHGRSPGELSVVRREPPSHPAE